MKIFVQKMLGKMARCVLWRHRPFVIGITGSIGKTTTKDALFTILSAHYNARTNIANYNNEFGVPLTVIGAPSGGKSLFGWARVVCVWLWTVLIGWRYPKILVLELGIDHVGDMDYLVDMVAPQMGVVTVVEGVHAEKFGSIATIAKEKGVLTSRLPKEGSAILNADDSRVAKMSENTKAHVTTYSAAGKENATIWASDVHFSGRSGISLKVNEGHTTVPVRLPHIIGIQMVSSVIAAVAAARAYGMNLANIAQALTQMCPPKRRMNLLQAPDDITIIDDSYNAAPASMRAALVTLGQFPKMGREARSIAVLGDMRELGDDEILEHQALAQSIIENNIDTVVCVGPLMKHLYDALTDACAKDYQVVAPYYFATTEEAVATITQIVTPGDSVLIKGSNGMHMWNITEKLRS